MFDGWIIVDAFGVPQPIEVMVVGVCQVGTIVQDIVSCAGINIERSGVCQNWAGRVLSDRILAQRQAALGQIFAGVQRCERILHRFVDDTDLFVSIRLPYATEIVVHVIGFDGNLADQRIDGGGKILVVSGCRMAEGGRWCGETDCIFQCECAGGIVEMRLWRWRFGRSSPSANPNYSNIYVVRVEIFQEKPMKSGCQNIDGSGVANRCLKIGSELKTILIEGQDTKWRNTKLIDTYFSIIKGFGYFCLLVDGFHSATAVSLSGLKNIELSYGLTANPMPCDDFLPTNRTGSSAPNCNGPARNALVLTENSLRMRSKHVHNCLVIKYT